MDAIQPLSPQARHKARTACFRLGREARQRGGIRTARLDERLITALAAVGVADQEPLRSAWQRGWDFSAARAGQPAVVEPRPRSARRRSTRSCGQRQ